MKKNILPILLVAGAALAFMAFRRRPRVTVTAESPEIQTGEQFEREYQQYRTAPKPSLIDVGSEIVSKLFAPKTEKEKAAMQARKMAVKRAIKTKTATRKQAKAVTKSLSQGIRIKGFNDNSVLV
jgi:hypothetical protein